MTFLGYDEKSKAFRCYDKESKKLVISRDVCFVGSRSEVKNHQVKEDKLKKRGKSGTVGEPETDEIEISFPFITGRK